ncbi:hypothetical protein MJD09_19185 [bacterium]|nr:hypothetical protein [bacterium]
MSKPTLVGATDSTLPFWIEDQIITRDTHGNAITATASSSNYFVLVDSQPVLYCEENGARIWRLAKIPQEALKDCIHLIKELLKSGPNSAIQEINSQAAAECKLAQVFLQNGFRLDGSGLVLSPMKS